jgi:hypothetical protein
VAPGNMSAITDFEVTYGGALATNKFHRIVDATGAGVDMNAGKLTFVLWIFSAHVCQRTGVGCFLTCLGGGMHFSHRACMLFPGRHRIVCLPLVQKRR